MNEVKILPDILTQLMRDKPIRFTHDGGEKEDTGFVNVRAMGRDTFLVDVLYPTEAIGNATAIKKIELNQQQVDTIGWSEKHNSFVGRF